MATLLQLPQELFERILEEFVSDITIETPEYEPQYVSTAAGMSTVRRIDDDDAVVPRQELRNLRLTSKEVQRRTLNSWIRNTKLNLQGPLMRHYLTLPRECWRHTRTIYFPRGQGQASPDYLEEDCKRHLANPDLGFAQNEIDKLAGWLSKKCYPMKQDFPMKKEAAQLYLGLHMFRSATHLEIIVQNELQLERVAELINLPASKHLYNATNLRVIHLVYEGYHDTTKDGLLSFLVGIAPKLRRLEVTGLNTLALAAWAFPAQSRRINELIVGPLTLGRIDEIPSLLEISCGLVRLEIDVRMFQLRETYEIPSEESSISVHNLLPAILQHASTLEHLTIWTGRLYPYSGLPPPSWIHQMSRMRHLTIPSYLLGNTFLGVGIIPATLETLNLTLQHSIWIDGRLMPHLNEVESARVDHLLHDLLVNSPPDFHEVRIWAPGIFKRFKRVVELYKTSEIGLSINQSSRWMIEREVRRFYRPRQSNSRRNIILQSQN